MTVVLMDPGKKLMPRTSICISPLLASKSVLFSCSTVEKSAAGRTTLPQEASHPSESNYEPTTTSSLPEEPTSLETMEVVFCVDIF